MRPWGTQDAVADGAFSALDFAPSEAHLLDMFLNEKVVESHCGGQRAAPTPECSKYEAGPQCREGNAAGAAGGGGGAVVDEDKIQIDMNLLCGDDLSESDGATMTP